MAPFAYTTTDFDYHLPAELIAQHPAAERDASHLIHWPSLTETTFKHVADFMNAGDMLILNQSRSLILPLIQPMVRHAKVRLPPRMGILKHRFLCLWVRWVR